MKKFDVEVVSPIAAVVLFGRAEPAVRKASREGHVRTELIFSLGNRPMSEATRLIEFESAKEYWGEPYARELKSMRETPIFIEMDGCRYKVLHPGGGLGVATRPPLTSSETWFRGR